MNQTPIELELPALSLSQPESEKSPDPPALFQLPLPAQDPQTHHQQSQRLSETNPEQQQQGPEKHIRLLLSLFGLLVSAAILSFIYYIYHKPLVETRLNVMPCLSHACQEAAARLYTSENLFNQSCDDLSHRCKFPSNIWGKHAVQDTPDHPQNQSAQHRKRHSLSRKTLLLQYLREILEDNESSSGSAVQKTKDFYRSCLNTSPIETAGVNPFLQLIQKLGGWPVSGLWRETDFNSTLLLLMRDYATFPFFNVHVGKDPNETASGAIKRYIQIDQPDLLIPIEWNNRTEKYGAAKAETLRPFLALCQKYLALLGSPEMTTTMHAYMFISFSSELAVAASPLHYRRLKGQLNHPMTIKELQIQAPAIHWLGCLQAIFHPLPLSEDDRVLLHNLPYIVHMSEIITKWHNKPELKNSGPLHTYMMLNLLHTLIPAMDSRFSETENTFSEALGHNHKEVPRWKHCVLTAEKGFDSVLSHLLRKRTAHKEVDLVIKDVFFFLKSDLHELQWKNQTYFQLVREKVNSLTPRLWTENKTAKEKELDLYFSQVNISSQDFFSNYVQHLSLWQKRRTELLTTQTDPVNILSPDPFILGNEVLFPMGMFIPPFFHVTYPRSLNYGAAGFITAKDVLHLLWPDIYSHSVNIKVVADCVWAHYLSVSETVGRGGMQMLSGAQQQELWVQYTALKVALQAYHRSLSFHPGDTSLMGRSHTHLFLTSFSEVSCDDDPFHEFMPVAPSFLVAVICAKNNLCPSLRCSLRGGHSPLQTC